jgi:hypothetical protein
MSARRAGAPMILFRTFLAALLALIALPATVAVVTAAPAHAEDNGVGLTPALGWSSWSFVRRNPTAAIIDAQADALRSSGLAAIGYQYANLDDFWYICPGSQGPNVDADGRWVIDPTKFPNVGAENGIQAVADHVHGDGLKFGLYVTPGISAQAVAQNTAIAGTPYHADDIATGAAEANYNCGGMVGIDYSKPGAQAFIDSWADQFASWGVDYLKLDGVGLNDVGDVAAWSQALRQTGRPIHLELSNSLAISAAGTWAKYSNGWRTGGDIECYGCEANGSSYPLTDWDQIQGRFDQVAAWQPYGGPGGFNDYDSIEVGNGAGDGLTPDERQTQLSLWALAASPLILGTDLTHLDPTDLGYLRNTAVLAVDQDAIDAGRIAGNATSQVFAKTEPNGDAIVGLFNTGDQPQVVSTTAGAVGLPASDSGYLLNNLWTHADSETAGTIAATVAPHGVALFRVRPGGRPRAVPPAVTTDLAGLSTLVAGQPTTATVSFTDDGVLPARQVRLALSTPDGWTATPASPTWFGSVGSGQTVHAEFHVLPPTSQQVFQTSTVTARAGYTWPAGGWSQQSVSHSVLSAPPVLAPYRTYSSAADAPAFFGQSGDTFGVSGAGPDLYAGTDTYSAVYLPAAVGPDSTVRTEVTRTQALSGYGKAGIMVRDDLTASGTGPEGVILYVSPSGGIQLEWNDNGGHYIDAVSPPNGSIAPVVPVWLTLRRAGDTYTGYYSTDGSTWKTVGSAQVPGQSSTQDAGLFVTSHTTGSPAQAVFSGLAVTPST